MFKHTLKWETPTSEGGATKHELTITARTLAKLQAQLPEAQAYVERSQRATAEPSQVANAFYRQIDNPHGLTPREKEVVRMMVEGKTNKEIAAALVITIDTVQSHVGSILHKAGARNRMELARKWK